MHVDPQDKLSHNYDLIIGTDLLQELGFNLDFNNKVIEWQGATAPMKDPNFFADNNGLLMNLQEELFESKAVIQAAAWMTKIAESRYEKADLEAVVAECTYLTIQKHNSLYHLSKQYEFLFDGTLGKWNLPLIDIKEKENVPRYHAKPFLVPKTYEKALQNEVEWLEFIEVLWKINISWWAALTFLIAKKLLPGETTPRIREVSDFQELNKWTEWIPYPLPKIQELLIKLEGFLYAMSLV